MDNLWDNRNGEEKLARFHDILDALRREIGRVIVGQDAAVEQVLTCLLIGGHALLEGVPGIGKTLLVRTLAETLELSFSRIQFTPDLMPADITGTMMLAESPTGRMLEFQPGPIFANLVLADEINRATPKTQSAVLEAMQEGTVSVANATHRLPEPMMVLATQNPIEMEGTYPLPEAQLDRFALKILIPAPPVEALQEILVRTTGPETPAAQPVTDGATLLELRRLVREVPAAEPVLALIAQMVSATHPHNAGATDTVQKYVRLGASPRGAQAILLAAKVKALLAGRASVAVEDVFAVAPAALRHRLILNFEAQADGVGPDGLIADVIRAHKPE